MSDKPPLHRRIPTLFIGILGVLLMAPAIFFMMPGGGMEERTIVLRGQPIEVELAVSDAQKKHGLMGRKKLDEDKGMLFVFDKDLPLSFWMKDTLIPLDILYFDNQQRLINAHDNAQPCPPNTMKCPTYPSQKPARYVLELAAGQAKKRGLVTGDKITAAQK